MKHKEYFNYLKILKYSGWILLGECIFAIVLLYSLLHQ